MVTGTEIGIIIGQIAVLVTAIGGILKQWHDNKKAVGRRDHTDAKIAEVATKNIETAENVKRLEVNTNSLSERNEAIAKKLGIEEGIAIQKSSNTPPP